MAFFEAYYILSAINFLKNWLHDPFVISLLSWREREGFPGDEVTRENRVSFSVSYLRPVVERISPVNYMSRQMEDPLKKLPVIGAK